MSVHDRWGGARTGTGKRWEVRWRQQGVQRKRRFDSKTAAETFEARRKLDPNTPQHRPQLTVGEMMATWLATKAGLEESTRLAYRLDVKLIGSVFGDRLASGVRPSEVRAWAARPHPGASLRRRGLVALRAAYRLAISDALIVHDPTEGAPLPRVERTEMRFLSWPELDALAREVGETGPLVWLLGTCGLRISEACALDGTDVDRVRGRLRVRRAKTHKPRDVPISTDVLILLPDTPGPLFRGPSGGRLDPHNWRERVFKPAALRAGFGAMHPHELRHTAASLAIASGADVKVVQRMLGHSSAAMTLDLYTGLWDAQLDSVTDRMTLAWRAQMGRPTLEEPGPGPATLRLVVP
jgi:integrase